MEFFPLSVSVASDRARIFCFRTATLEFSLGAKAVSAIGVATTDDRRINRVFHMKKPTTVHRLGRWRFAVMDCSDVRRVWGLSSTRFLFRESLLSAAPCAMTHGVSAIQLLSLFTYIGGNMSLNVHCIYEANYADPKPPADMEGCFQSVKANSEKAVVFYRLAVFCNQYVKDLKGNISVQITKGSFPMEGHIHMILPMFIFTSLDLSLLRQIVSSGENTVSIMPIEDEAGIRFSIHVPLSEDITGFERIVRDYMEP